MTGVMTNAPTASRNHHMAHGAAAFAQSTDPVRPRPPTPMVAPIIALSPRLTSANLATPAGVSKVLRPSDQTLITKPPTSASIVLAAAIAAEIKIELASVASTGSASMPAANAATKMAGQTRSPSQGTQPPGPKVAQVRLRPTRSGSVMEQAQRQVSQAQNRARQQRSVPGRTSPDHEGPSIVRQVELWSRKTSHCMPHRIHDPRPRLHPHVARSAGVLRTSPMHAMSFTNVTEAELGPSGDKWAQQG
jgi:hypothetical protein